jgi:hypothetical protein
LESITITPAVVSTSFRNYALAGAVAVAVLLVDTRIRTGPMSWDISLDGNRFLIISDNSQETSSMNLILNWRPDQQK